MCMRLHSKRQKIVIGLIATKPDNLLRLKVFADYPHKLYKRVHLFLGKVTGKLRSLGDFTYFCQQFIANYQQNTLVT